MDDRTNYYRLLYALYLLSFNSLKGFAQRAQVTFLLSGKIYKLHEATLHLADEGLHACLFSVLVGCRLSGGRGYFSLRMAPLTGVL